MHLLPRAASLLAPSAPAPRHRLRPFVRCLLGAGLTFILSFLLSPVDKIHGRPPDVVLGGGAEADSIEIYDSRDSVPTHESFRTVTDREKVTTALQEIEKAPGAWQPGRFKEPNGYLYFVFQKRRMDPPGNDLLILLRLAPGFLIRGSGAHWEYQHIDAATEARLAALGLTNPDPR